MMFAVSSLIAPALSGTHFPGVSGLEIEMSEHGSARQVFVTSKLANGGEDEYIIEFDEQGALTSIVVVGRNKCGEEIGGDVIYPMIEEAVEKEIKRRENLYRGM